MAEALVSKVLEQLASITLQQMEEGIKLVEGIDEEMGRLTSNFQAIQAVLIDAEKRQVKENAVRDWLDKVKDISYDVDDVLDERNTTIQKLQLEKVEDALKVEVCSLHPFYLCCHRRLVLHDDIAVKIRNLDRKLEIITIEKDRFQFSLIPKGTTEEELEKTMTTSVIDITEVHGRDEEKNRLLDLLLGQSSQGQVLPIISIIGMRGSGKTTLARLVFNDEKVKTHFDKKIWVNVSKPFNEMRIVKAIHESVGTYKLEKLESLLQGISRGIRGRKFLLVLDDVWTENPINWVQLKNTLNDGSQESRILITTHIENAARAIGTTHMMTLGTLVDEECWSIFSKIAFFGKTHKESEILKEIGKKIVQKCEGVPFAIKILASLLRFKTKIEEWQDVLDSEIWEMEEAEQRFFPPLLLSYYDLSLSVKICFSFCAIFPEDYQIEKAELIKLWMAKGYLKVENNKDKELVGEEYFKILVMRSFFQDFEKDEHDEIVSFKIRDIIHDFAQFLTQKECFSIDDDGFREYEHESVHKKFRHSTIKVHKDGPFPRSIYTQKFLRSLVIASEFERVKKTSLSKLFDKLTCLRTLNLRNQNWRNQGIVEIPININKLIHLRYLNLSYNRELKVLPETLCELYNLIILDIRGCVSLKKLPQGIGKLINLRCLENWGTYLSYMPKSFERLTGLRTLYRFVVSGGGYSRKACSLECLKHFNDLQMIEIKSLGELRSVNEAEEAQLHNKENLRDLYLNFEGSVNKDHVGLLEALRPSPNLKKLRIQCYNNACALFPDWIMSLTNLRELNIEYCESVEHLYCLGKLSSLESLVMRVNGRLKRMGNEFLGIESDVKSSSSSLIFFPKLKYLLFWDMREWEEWNYEIEKSREDEITIMPCLQTLRISFCPELKSLPNRLRHMTSLEMQIQNCPLLEELKRSDRPSSSSAAVTN